MHISLYSLKKAQTAKTVLQTVKLGGLGNVKPL